MAFTGEEIIYILNSLIIMGGLLLDKKEAATVTTKFKELFKVPTGKYVKQVKMFDGKKTRNEAPLDFTADGKTTRSYYMDCTAKNLPVRYYVPDNVDAKDYGSPAHIKRFIEAHLTYKEIMGIIDQLKKSPQLLGYTLALPDTTMGVRSMLRGFHVMNLEQEAGFFADQATQGNDEEEQPDMDTSSGTNTRKRAREDEGDEYEEFYDADADEQDQGSQQPGSSTSNDPGQGGSTPGPNRKRFKKAHKKFGRFESFKKKYSDPNHPMYRKKVSMVEDTRLVKKATIYSSPDVAFAHLMFARASQTQSFAGDDTRPSDRKDPKIAVGNFILTCLAAFLPGILFNNVEAFDDRQYGDGVLGYVQSQQNERVEYPWPTRDNSQSRYLEGLKIGFMTCLSCIKPVTSENIRYLSRRWESGINQSELEDSNTTNAYNFDEAILIDFSKKASDYVDKSELYFFLCTLIAEVTEEKADKIQHCLYKQVELVCEYIGMPRIRLMISWAGRFDSTAHYCMQVVDEIIRFLLAVEKVKRKVTSEEFPYLRLTRPHLLEPLSARLFPHLCFCATEDAKMTKNLAEGYAGKEFPMTMSAARLRSLLKQKVPDVGSLSDVQVAQLEALGIRVEQDIDEVVKTAKRRKRQLVESDSD